MTASDHHYVPADAGITLEALAFLRTPQGAQLRHAAAQLPNPSVADIAALRKSFPTPAIHAALTLAESQKKARLKFPHIPYLWCTPEALEQATSYPVALHKAERLRDLAPTTPRVYDLCCGIGGDTLALAQFFPVTAVDLSPIRTACLQYNLADNPAPHPVEILTTDLRSIQIPAGSILHIDPARRSAGNRSPAYADLIPPPSILDKLFASNPGLLKLSSAVDFDSLPPGHLELISHHNTVVQALLWRNTSLPANLRTATLCSNHAPPFSFTAAPANPHTHSPTNTLYLYELNPAFTRANLAAPFATAHQLTPITSDGGYLLSDTLLTHPALTPFQLLTILPYSEKRAIDALRKLPATTPGPVEVKTRGRIPGVDTDSLQLAFSKASPSRRTVFIFRQNKTTLAALANRL